MKVGDLVKAPEIAFIDGTVIGPDIGLVIEVINGIEVPPVVKVLWPNGVIDKEWTDELEVVNENR